MRNLITFPLPLAGNMQFNNMYELTGFLKFKI